jgi:hypothetical protein
MTDISRQTMIYKMTHLGDPDPRTGVWGGDCDCMGRERNAPFAAVIGVGGKSAVPRLFDKVLWIGIGPVTINYSVRNGRIMQFEHILIFGSNGPAVSANYPALARMMYDTPSWRRKPFQHVPGRGDADLDREVRAILRLAEDAPASSWGRPRRGSPAASGIGRSI